MAGEVKEFGFRPVPEGRQLPDSYAPPPLQPVPVPAPGMVADPRLALSIGVAGSIAVEEVHALCASLSDPSIKDLLCTTATLTELCTLLFPVVAVCPSWGRKLLLAAI